jgi:hypothetical protein
MHLKKKTKLQADERNAAERVSQPVFLEHEIPKPPMDDTSMARLTTRSSELDNLIAGKAHHDSSHMILWIGLLIFGVVVVLFLFF